MTDERVEVAKSMISHEADQRQGEENPKFKITSGRDLEMIGIKKYKESPRSGQYDRLVGEAKAIFEDRNAIYKDAFNMLGLIGTVSTLIGDTQRLRNMIYFTPDHGRSHKENIKDKLIDVINQGIISLMVLEEENYEGK